MGNLTDEQQKIREALNPHIKALHDAIAKFPDLRFSGFVFNLEESILMHFTNSEFETPEDLIFLHQVLTVLHTRLLDIGAFQRDEFPSEEEDPIPKITPESIADKLAIEISMLPADMIPEPVRNTASEYLSARIPKGKS